MNSTKQLISGMASLKFLTTVALSIMGVASISCGALPKKDEAKAGAKVKASRPADSTGAQVPIKLNLTNSKKTQKLMLTNASSNVLTNAYLSVAELAFYASATADTDEKDAKKELADEERKNNKSEKDDEAKEAEEGNEKKEGAAVASNAKDQDRVAAELAHSKDINENIKTSGMFVYDAVSTASQEIPDSVVLNDGTYRRIEGQFVRNATVAKTHPLYEQAFAIKGSAGTVPFLVRSKKSVSFRLLMGANPFIVAPGKASFILSFDTSTWLTGVDFTSATKSTDGSVLIDDTTNASLLNQVQKNIRRSVLLEGDDGADLADGKDGADDEEKEEKEIGSDEK